MKEFSAGIITVSDTCSAGTAVDTSGPKLQELLRSNFTPNIIKYELIPDDIKQIESTLIYFTDVLRLDLIISTGGTGFGPRDVTPEATKNVIHREAPQLALVMSLYSLEKTKFAALSRAICGIRNRSLIINMPGSKKAVIECFESICGIIPHALQHMNNDVMEIRKVHVSLQAGGSKAIADAGDKCCSAHSNQAIKIAASTASAPTKATPHKHICPHKTGSGDGNDRNSPYPMIPVDQCLQLVLGSLRKLPTVEEHISHLSLPPFRASIKDGYAVISSGGKGKKRVIGYISAGDEISKHKLADDECFKINTGAPVPTHSDSIIQVEDTKVLTRLVDGTEDIIEIFTEPTVDLDIRSIGCDLIEGENLFTNHNVYPGSVTYKSILASVGKVTELEEPMIGVISTGDELIEPGQELQPGKIYDSNMTMLVELLKQFGFSKIKTIIAKDSYDSLKSGMTSMVNDCQITICTGGVSMGDKDFVKAVVQDLGFKIHFGRVNMKPGKPMTFAANADGRAVFGLPGNPVSSFVTFHLFVLPAIRYIMNYDLTKLSLPKITVELLNDSLELDPRPEYARATITLKNGKFYAKVKGDQISSRLRSIDGADVLLHLPAATAQKPLLSKGTPIHASVLRLSLIHI